LIFCCLSFFYCLALLAASLSISIIERKRVLVQACRLAHLFVCRFWRVYCGKTAGWIWMPFGVVSGVGQEMSVLDGGPHPVRGSRADLWVTFCFPGPIR